MARYVMVDGNLKLVDYEYLAMPIRVVDGDTFDAAVDLGFGVHMKLRFRMDGVDTPERGEEGFEEASAVLEGLLEEHADNQSRLLVRSFKTGKYGRYLAHVTGADGTDINRIMAKRWPYQPKT